MLIHRRYTWKCTGGSSSGGKKPFNARVCVKYTDYTLYTHCLCCAVLLICGCKMDAIDAT